MNSRTRRDLPSPAGATIDTSRQRPAQALREQVLERGQLLLAADDRRVQTTLEPGCVRSDVAQAPGRAPAPPDLSRDRHDEFRVHGASHQPIGGFAEQDLTCGRMLLEPGRDVDRVSGHEPLIGLASPATTSPVLTPIRLAI